MSASLEEFRYKGGIDEELIKRINELEFTFLQRIYFYNSYAICSGDFKTSRKD